MLLLNIHNILLYSPILMNFTEQWGDFKEKHAFRGYHYTQKKADILNDFQETTSSVEIITLLEVI